MSLEKCPYCDSPSLALTVRPILGGTEVAGHCSVCGYASDSNFTMFDADETDLPYEFVLNAERFALD